MPTYEYRCRDCGHEFEQMQKITADPIKDCPECGGEKVQRLVSASSFHLKGSGWYKTDYASSSSSSGASSSTDKKSTSSTTTAKSESSSAPKKETKVKTDSA